MRLLSSPFLHPTEAPLSGSTNLWHISCSSWFGVISKFAEGAICLISQIIHENIEQDWTRGTPLAAVLKLYFALLTITL